MLHDAERARDVLQDARLFDGVLWRRPLAYVIDFLIVGAVIALLWVVVFLLGILTLGLAWFLLAPGTLLSFPVVAIAYDTLLLSGRHAATWGMRLFDLELRSTDGSRPSPLQAALQSLLFYGTVAVTGSLILLVALLNPRHRLVHDFLSGTAVIRADTSKTMLVP